MLHYKIPLRNELLWKAYKLIFKNLELIDNRISFNKCNNLNISLVVINIPLKRKTRQQILCNIER